MLRRAAVVGVFGLLSLGAVGCNQATTGDQGGAMLGNDRSSGGAQGEELMTGQMLVAHSGKYTLLQRNDVSVVLDVANGTTKELPFQAARFVFANKSDVGYAWDGSSSLVAFDLATVTEKWRAKLSTINVSVLGIDDQDTAVVLGGGYAAAIVDAKTGNVPREIVLPTPPTSISFVPGKQRAVFVGTTEWTDHKPTTKLRLVDLANSGVETVSVPNCSAPIAMLPDGSRGFLSPTFCEESLAAGQQKTWTNPDPVSVIDFDATSGSFLKNLPGFGPVALDEKGSVAVAYLDTARMDAAMFDDKGQVPSTSGDPYHLMVIDPHTLKFSLTPIGHSLPRFAMGRDGKELLVDASVRVERMEAKVTLNVDSNGVSLSAKAAFGSDAPFGTFDLATLKYQGFTGPLAALDRFVQTTDSKVFTLKATADGLGGDLFAIDLNAKTTVKLDKSLRDIGLLPDGKTLVLRVRLPAVKRDDGFHRAEEICFSLDGIRCEDTVYYESKAPIPGSTSTCSDYHDCI